MVFRPLNCTYCGKPVDKERLYVCQKVHLFGQGTFIGFCSDCVKKCKKCGKYFCPKHIDNHKCK